MPRPFCRRRIAAAPPCNLFVPVGAPCGTAEEVTLTLDELEALRLADLEGLYQEEAAERMNVSRQTFARIVESARKKVAQALVEGKALRIEGGIVEVMTMRRFVCSQCKKEWEVPFGTGRPQGCPQCGSADIHRHPEDRGGFGKRGRGRCLRGRRISGQAGTANLPQTAVNVEKENVNVEEEKVNVEEGNKE
ncbi:MAG: DUF134 domain-containing protein [Thermogutta sp.]|nr:DUF134 domain-containing protein [Thermogutta sp.]